MGKPRDVPHIALPAHGKAPRCTPHRRLHLCEVKEVKEDEKGFEVREVREVKEVRDDTTCGGNVTGWALNCKTIVFNFLNSAAL